jgi:malonyl-CoA decarboxylase
MAMNSWLNSIADAGRELWTKASQRNGKSIKDLCQQLSSNKGEAMGTALAYAFVTAYKELDEQGKADFFELLLSDYSQDSNQIIRRADAYKAAPNSANLAALTKVVRSPRRLLFQRINMAPDGTHLLVNMRKDLLHALKVNKELSVVDSDLQQLLETWFNRGFLKIRRIDWRTPAHILEKLIAYEAVHEMDGWDDLRRRLEDDRRCFAFFHPALEDEPLIFVEVALVDGLATAVQPLLAPRLDQQVSADTAIFYSISNCQKGLKGISFGNFLIKQVVMELQEELPKLKHFATLSPIPGFSRWLELQLADKNSAHVTKADKEIISWLKPGWHLDGVSSEPARDTLMRLCLHYLVEQKRGVAPLDPVARFHLGNGARVEQLNWLGDTSANGVGQSYGILVNYGYKLNHVEENHEAFVNQNIIAQSKTIAAQLKMPALTKII